MADLGRDLACVDDLTPDMSEVTGRRCLAEAIARRYQTDRGSLIGDPNYGFNLTNFVNSDLGTGDLAALQSGAEAEALKDERVLAVTVVATQDTQGLMTVTVTLTDAAGPFILTLAVSAVTVKILDLKP
jgi:phage baseplate assembly protein W